MHHSKNGSLIENPTWQEILEANNPHPVVSVTEKMLPLKTDG
jgi:hypothetical protein